jgi:uncharacterized protein YajQ (UPF0234 family)
MADTYSFDIACKIEAHEVQNAVAQAEKELANRYDLKDSNSEIVFQADKHLLKLESVDEFTVRAVLDILKQKLMKREISPKALTEGEVKSSLGGRAKMEITLQNGVPKEKAKDIVKFIKDTKAKVQTQIQDDQLRVTSKSIDELQKVLKAVRAHDFGIVLMILNLR